MDHHYLLPGLPKSVCTSLSVPTASSRIPSLTSWPESPSKNAGLLNHSLAQTLSVALMAYRKKQNPKYFPGHSCTPEPLKSDPLRLQPTNIQHFRLGEKKENVLAYDSGSPKAVLFQA